MRFSIKMYVVSRLFFIVSLLRQYLSMPLRVHAIRKKDTLIGFILALEVGYSRKSDILDRIKTL